MWAHWSSSTEDEDCVDVQFPLCSLEDMGITFSSACFVGDRFVMMTEMMVCVELHLHSDSPSTVQSPYRFWDIRMDPAPCIPQTSHY